MSTTRPLVDVDVVIPLYNGRDHVLDTIRSVLNGSVLPKQIIVMDDGSTDGSVEVVQDLVRTHGTATRITILQQLNQGPNAARNAGIAAGTAPLVALLDADDLWMPSKLEEQLTLIKRSGAALVYCGYHEIDAKGQVRMGSRIVAPELRGRVFDRLMLENRISGSSSAVLVRRDVLDKVGPFDASLKGSEDWDMWLRIAEGHSIDAVPKDLVAIRRHAASAQADTLAMLRNMIAFQAKWFAKARSHAHVMKHWGHLIAEFTLRSQDRKAALEAVRTGLTPEQRSILFRRTGGSLPLYLVLKRISAFLRGSA